MKIPKHLLTIASILALAAIVQANPFTKLDFLIGHWSGSGSGSTPFRTAKPVGFF